jgi:hypothetical protein
MNLRPLNSTFSAHCVLGLALLAGPAEAQVADRGILVIRAGGREIGLEAFQVTPSPTGMRIITRASYLSPRPGVELNASLDRTGDSEGAFQLGRKAGVASAEVYAVLKRSRLTIRRVERGAEQASESPGGAGLVLLSDSVFALYLQLAPLATEAGSNLTAVFPQSVRRVSFTAQKLPSTEPGGTLIRFSGGLDGLLELGSRGELVRLSLPGSGLEATRKRD